MIYETEPPYIRSLSIPQAVLREGHYRVTVNISEALEASPTLSVAGGIEAEWDLIPALNDSGEVLGVLGVTVNARATDNATVWMTLTDIAGNMATAPVRLETDTVSPTVLVTGLPGQMVYQWPTLNVSSTDNRGALSVRYAWNDGPWQAIEGGTALSTGDLDPAQTTHRLMVEATDAAGNAGHFEGTLRADVLRPYVTAVAMTPTISREGTVSITIKTHGRPVTPDMVIHARPVVWTDRTDAGGYSQAFSGTYRVLADDVQGTATVTLSIPDTTGQIVVSDDVLLAMSGPLQIDTISPVATDSVLSGAIRADETWFANGDAITWTLALSEPAQINSGLPLTATASVSGKTIYLVLSKTAEGPQTVTVSLSDVAGNETPIPLTWVWDGVLPTVQSVVMTNGFATWNGTERPVLGARDTRINLVFDEPVTASATAGLTLSAGQQQVPARDLTVSGNQVTAMWPAASWQGLGDGDVSLAISNFVDRSGNSMTAAVVTAQVDTTPPVLTEGIWQSTALGVTQSVFDEDGRYKLSESGARLTFTWSETIATPTLALHSRFSGKTVAVPLAAHDGMTSTATVQLGSDWTAEPLKDAIVLEPVIVAMDLAGNAVVMPRTFLALDVQAPQVVERGVDGGARDGEGYAVIKPYGVSGEEDELRFWVGFSEPTYQPVIKIYRVAANEADDVLIRQLDMTSKYVTGNLDTAFSVGGSAAQRAALGAAFDGLQFKWDGKDGQGKLVGGSGDDFYRVKIEARDRAGNWAVQNLEGLIKVRSMDVGVHVVQNRSPIASPLTGKPVETDVVFAVYSHDIKSSADFFEKYPTRNLRAFSTLPKVGQYRAVIRDGFGNVVRTLEEKPLRVNDFFVPKTMRWDGKDDRGNVPQQGRYFVEVIVSDNAGNAATTNVSGNDLEIQWDATPPVLSEVHVPGIAQNSQGAYVTSINQLEMAVLGTDTGSDVADVRTVYRLNTGAWTSAAGPLPLDNKEGDQTLAIAVVDAAGNTSNIRILSVFRDTQPPVATLSWTGALDGAGGKDVSANG
ncbi:MAG: hypothetical protein AAB066_04445, partial [Candidatus Margulisiibacteriota bacterium]